MNGRLCDYIGISQSRIAHHLKVEHKLTGAPDDKYEDRSHHYEMLIRRIFLKCFVSGRNRMTAEKTTKNSMKLRPRPRFHRNGTPRAVTSTLPDLSSTDSSSDNDSDMRNGRDSAGSSQKQR